MSPLLPNRESKISQKIIWTVSLVTVICIGLFSFVLLDRHHNEMIIQLEQNAHQLSETIKNSVHYDMLHNRFEHVHQIIGTISRQDGIEIVRIYNKEGTVVYSGNGAEIGKSVDQQDQACYGCHANEQPFDRLPINDRTRIFNQSHDQYRLLGIINPIYNEPSCWQADCHAHPAEQKVLGVLDVALDLNRVDEQLFNSRIKVILFTIITIIVISSLIWFLFKRWVVKPVRGLVSATSAVASGDFGYQIPIDRKDEIGVLEDSFNKMTLKLKEAEQQVYRSAKMASLGRLAAGVAHELNNPLSAVLTFSSYLLRDPHIDKSAQEDLKIVVREARRCRDIVRGLLDFSRQTPHMQPDVSVIRVMEHSLAIVQNQMIIKNISVTKDYEEAPLITADTNQLEQVFVNLFVNAIDAIQQDNGNIHIKITAVSELGHKGVKIVLRDTGIGIDEDDLSRIFEPFYSTKGQKGTGLGLSVVWSIITGHGGTIKVESKAGLGTTFRIFLPKDPIPHDAELNSGVQTRILEPTDRGKV
ncbi:HAMP domain-containing protein [candidate division KSB1 bacterium]|nr:HAMP domain-containing protein [candidate division KSB1 bacterium]